MSTRSRSRFLAIALSLMPGWGHIYWGRELLGLSLFTAFAVSGFGLFNSLFIYVGSGGEALTWIFLVLVGGLALGTWFDLLRRTTPHRLRAETELREQNLRAGIVAYLRGDLGAASHRFKSCLRVDPFDVEALFRLGVVSARAGDLRQATHCLRRTLKYDLDEKWQWEVERELERLKARPATLASGERSGGTPQRRGAGEDSGPAGPAGDLEREAEQHSV